MSTNGDRHWVSGSHLRVETHAILWLYFGALACEPPPFHAAYDGGLVVGGSLDAGSTGGCTGGAGTVFSKVSEPLSTGEVPSLRWYSQQGSTRCPEGAISP